MAKDDYYVIAYQILAYLYQCLKSGTEADEAMLQPDSRMLQINERYWSYILYHLSKSGYIEGVGFVSMDGSQIPYVTGLQDCMITPEGIDYLCENRSIKKAFQYLKEAKEILPFLIP